MTLWWIVPLAIGGAVGAALSWLWLRSQSAALQERLAAARAAGESLESTRADNERLRIAAAERAKEREADAEKVAWVERARGELEQAFVALAARALRENSGEFVRDAGEKLVQPLEKTLVKLGEQVRELESKRAGAYGELLAHLKDIQRANAELSRTTTTLSQALHSSGTRGRWGEMQLRRVVELCGMQRHVDFSEQERGDDGRPDMIINLPNGGRLPIDAKVTMTAYLESLGAADENARRGKLEEHAEALRKRIRDLGEKQYWKQFDPAPEFVVMFVPVEASLSAAFESRPELLETAIEQRVLLATPVTLLALLKAVAFGWQQHRIAENIKVVERECQTLYSRLVPFMQHLSDIGVRLEGAVKAYNAGVGSLQTRVLPVAERLRELGAGTEALPSPKPVEQQPRPPLPRERPPRAGGEGEKAGWAEPQEREE